MDRRDPVEILLHQARTRTPELVPIRHGRMLALALRVLPRRGGDDGRRPRRARRSGLARAAVRRCAPRQLRRLRGAGPRGSSSTSTTSTRRCRAVGVGRQAPGRQHRGRRPRSRASAAARASAVVPRRSRAYREAMRELRRDAHARRLVRAARRDEPCSQCAAAGRRSASACARRVDKARRKDSLRAFAKLTARGRGRSRGSSATRRWSCRSPSSPAPRTPSWRERLDGCVRDYRDEPAADRRHLLDALPARRRRAQGRRRRQRRHALPGSCCCSGATTDDPLFLQVKEAEPSVLEPYAGRQPSTPTRAGASSRASG